MKKGKILLVSSLVFFGTLIGTTLTSCGSNETEKEEDKYTVQLSFDNTKGSVKASTTSGKVGEKVTLTITPSTGYEVGTIKINGSSVESTTREFTPIKGENTVAVTFNLIVDPVDTAEVTLVQADHGTISASKTSGNVGDEIIVTVTPESGYELEWLKHNDTDITETKKFTLVSGENKLTASFKKSLVPAQLRTFYFKDVDALNEYGTTAYVYAYNSKDDSIRNADWPGEEITYLSYNIANDGANIYTFDLDVANYDTMILSTKYRDQENPIGQTINIDLNTIGDENNFIVLSEENKDEIGKYIPSYSNYETYIDSIKSTVNVTYDESLGEVTYEGEEFYAGNQLVLNATPIDGYEIESVTLNGEVIKMDCGGLDLNASVDITNTDALKAFKLIDADNKVIYNVYNLLRGDDNWDPLAQEEQIKALNAADMPLSLTAYVDSEVGKPQSVTLETGKDTATLLFDINGLYGSNYKDGITATWSVLDEELTDLVKLEPTTNGESCVVTPLNELYHPVVIIVEVKTNTGFVGAVELTINPEIRQAPEFTKAPEIVLNGDGTATLDYELNVGEFKETSTIKWYVADDNASTNKILIQDDHKTIIGKDVKLTKAYVDKYLVAEITPSHIISEVGETVEIISKTRITAQGIVDNNEVVLTPSLFPTAAQTAIIPGFFTVDTYAPSLEAGEDANGEWNIKGTPGSNNSWGYGVGPKDGYLNYAGLYQNGFGARLVYTPLNQSVGDMSVEVKGAPGKTAGQGFGSDRNYMDLFIKYDLATKTGYAVRIYRVSGSSCGVVLIEFNNGIPTMLTGKEEHITSGYLTEFTLKAWTETIEGKTTLHASLDTTAQESTDNQLEHSVSVSAEIEENGYGAFGLHYVSSAGAAGNSTYIGSMKATYNGSFQNEVATSVQKEPFF